MNIYKQIIFLSLLLVVVMISCLAFHINDFEELIEEPSKAVITTEIQADENKDKNIEQEDKIVDENIVKEDIIKDDVVEEKTTEEKINNKTVVDVIKDESKEVISNTPSNEKIDRLSKLIQPKNETVISKSIQDEIDEILSKQKIFFKRLSTEITEESFDSVKKISEVMLKYPNMKIEIGGHTDAKGKDDVNEWVSLQRALSVKKELISFGIAKKRIKAKGYGETQPLVPNDKNGYSIENRRVEFKVIEE